jgi:Na+-driven multidrug efflux pump
MQHPSGAAHVAEKTRIRRALRVATNLMTLLSLLLCLATFAYGHEVIALATESTSAVSTGIVTSHSRSSAACICSATSVVDTGAR